MRKDTPMFLYHGKNDQILPLKATEVTYAYLKDEVYAGSDKLDYATEGGLAHSLSQKEERKMKEWMQQHMKE